MRSASASRIVGSRSTSCAGASTTAGGEQARLIDDERHSQRGFVGEHAVRGLAVIAERLAMIRGEHDQRPSVSAAVRIGSSRGSERGVGGRDSQRGTGSPGNREANGSGGAYGKCGS